MDFDKALSEIYPWILRIARKYCWSLQDAEDLAGETVIKMLLNRDKFDNSKPMKPWCIAIMQNTYITYYNRNSLVHYTSYNEAIEHNSSYNAHNSAVFHDLVSAIRRSLHRSCCIECVIYYAKGYSYDEISEIVGIPVGTVRSRISSGRRIVYQEIGY